MLPVIIIIIIQALYYAQVVAHAMTLLYHILTAIFKSFIKAFQIGILK